MLPLFLSISNL